MADQKTTFGIEADTSAIEKLSQSLKGLDDSAAKMVSSFAAVNKITESAPKAINEYAESFSGLGQKAKQTIPDLQKFIDTEKSAQEVIKETTRNFKERGDQLLRLSQIPFDPKNLPAVIPPTPPILLPPIVPPPTIPPVATAGTPAGDDPSKRAAALLARAQAIKDVLQTLGLEKGFDDQGATERLRSKVNSLATAMGLGKSGITDLARALQILDTGAIEPTTGKIIQIINRLQDLQRISRDVKEAEEVAQVAATRVAQAPSITLSAVGALGGTPQALVGLRAEDAARVKADIDRVNDALTKGRVSAADVTAALNKIATNGFEPLSGGAKVAYTALVRINDVLKDQQSSAQRSTEVNDKLKAALAGIGVSEKTILGLDPGRAQTARVAINNLATAFINGKISADDLDKAVASFSSKSIVALTGGAAAAAAQLGNLKTVTAETGGFLSGVGTRLVNVFSNVLLRRGLFALTQAIRDAFKETFVFETDLLKIGIAANASESAIDKLRGQIESLARSTGRVRLDLANASVELFRSKNFDVGNAPEALNTVINLSKVAFSDTNTSAKALVSTLDAYGLSAGDADRTSRLLFAATQAGRADLKQVEAVLEGTSIAANQLGFSLEEVLAAFVSLRDKGVPAGRATQTLSTLFNRLVQPNKEANAAVGKFGFESTVAASKALGLQGVLKLISEESKTGTGRLKEFSDTLLGADPNISKISTSTVELGKSVDKFDETLDRVNRDSTERFNRAIANFRGGITTLAESAKKAVVIFVEANEAAFKFLFDVRPPAGLKDVEDALDRLKKKQGEAAAEAEKSNKATEQSYRGLFATIEKEAFNTLLTLRQNFQNNSVAIGESFANVGELVKKITADANTAIRQSQKEIVSFAQNIAQRSFQKRIDILPPSQQFVELQQRLNELTASAREFFAAGKAQEGRGVLKEAENIIIKFEEINNKLATQQGQTSKALDKNFTQHIQNLDKILGSQDKLSTENIKFLNKEFDALTRYAKAYDSPFLRANALNEIEGRKLALLERELETQFQLNQAGISGTAQDTEKKIIAEREGGIKRILELTQKQRELQNQIDTEEQRRTKLPKGIIDVLQQAQTELPSGLEAFARSLSGARIGNVKDSLETAQEAAGKLSANLSPENINNFLDKFSKLRAEVEALRAIRDPDERNPFQSEVNTLDTAIDRTRTLFKDLTSRPQENQQLDAVNHQLEALKGGVPAIGAAITNTFNEAATSSQNLTTNIANFNIALDGSLNRLNGIIERLTTINQIPINPIAPAIPLEGRASGGIITGRPGVDTNLIRVSRGEFVVNSDATNRFFPQLVAMNSFRGFAGGGLVSNTSVGNITVNVTAQSTEQANIRNIGQAINREIRRGTLKF